MKKINIIIIVVAITIVSFNCIAQKNRNGITKEFSSNLMQDSCTLITTGRNTYFILDPGYQLTLGGIHKNDTTLLVITVLNETKKIGGIETRVVEENESVNGKTIEISRNFFALCKQTNSIFYFGEEVDIYKDGKVVNHDGAWIAEGNNKAGIALPGVFLLGSRYYQEIAPGIAMDRAEIISISETFQTPDGKYSNVLKIEETTPLEPNDISYKLYAPGIGLVKDDNLVLLKHGFIK
jgi:hypothetical protein